MEAKSKSRSHFTTQTEKSKRSNSQAPAKDAKKLKKVSHTPPLIRLQAKEETKKASKAERAKSTDAPAIASTSKEDQAKIFSSVDTFTDMLGTWKEPLKGAISNSEFKKLFEFVKAEYNDKSQTCFPPAHQIFNAYQQATFSNIKVVILG